MAPIVYFMIFANLSKSFLNEIHWVRDHSSDIIRSQWLSVLILAVIIFPLIIKKKIEELKIAGFLLFTGVTMFIILISILKVFNGESLEKVDTSFHELYSFRADKAFLSSLSTAFVAYGFQSAFFPIYNSLENKSYSRGLVFTILGMGFCFIIYTLVMFVSLYSFGK